MAVMNCVPLISDRPSFASSVIGDNPAARERLGPAHAAAVHRGLAFPDERQGEVRERSEIAARPDRAA